MSAANSTAWIDAMRSACSSHTQADIAQRIGYSAAVVNQVLKGTYRGDLKRVQQAVEGALMALNVDCPVAGEMPRQRCAEYQRRGFALTNPMRVALSRACKTCPNRSNS